MPAEPVVILALCLAGLALVVGLAPTRQQQRRFVVRGTTGLAGVAVVALAPSLSIALPIVIGLGILQAAATGTAGFAVRLRPIVLAGALIALALVFARVPGPDVLQRFAGIGAAAGVAAAVGVLPYLHQLDAEAPVTTSPIVWLGFIGPVLASLAVLRLEQVLGVEAGAVFGATLLALGLVNIVWGSLGAWWTESEIAAWRYSFVADWGLVLCGFGLAAGDARSGALLMLFAIVLGRLPLYVASREPIRERAPMERPVNLVVAALLAGSAPFAGFAARLLLLRGATQLYWPLALVLVLGMLLWLPGSLRLGRSVGRPRPRQAVAIAIVIALNVIAGLYPQPLLAAAGH